MYRRIRICILALVTALAVLLTSLPGLPPKLLAEEGTETAPLMAAPDSPALLADLPTYADFLEANADAASPAGTVEAPGQEAAGDAVLSDRFGREGLASLSGEGLLEWEVEVAEDGLYGVTAEFHTLSGNNREFVFDLLVDGQLPYKEAADLVLRKTWKDTTPTDGARFQTDLRGNELTPSQTEPDVWVTRALRDLDGFYPDPLRVRLTAGRHSVALRFSSGGIAVDRLLLSNPEPPPLYADYLSGSKSLHGEPSPSASATMRIEAELPASKTDSMLHPTTDRSSAASSPADASKVLLNTIGLTNWKRNGQALRWDFQVAEAGYYAVDLRVRQNMLRGFSSTRTLRLDGQVPFKEAARVEFPFQDDWYVQTLGGQESPWLFYLEAGPHSLELEAVLSFPTLCRDLENLVFDLNAAYRQIIMVTGVTPDPYRDYRIELAVPELLPALQDVRMRMDALTVAMGEAGFSTGSEAVVVGQLSARLADFIDRPYTIPTNVAVLKDSVSTLSAFALRLKDQPLEIDFLDVRTPDIASAHADVGFFESLLYGLRVYFASYTMDYTRLDNTYGQEAVNVWISAGRDQAQVIKWLVDSDFIPRTGIPVNVNLVQGAAPGASSQALISATITGRGPDVAIFAQPVEIMNLAVRGTLVDLREFPGIDGIESRFQENSFKPYTYMDSLYAIPVAESYSMMFYRTDVFAELGLAPPTTWSEFYRIVPVLQRHNLLVGIQGLDDTSFRTLLFQQGGSYYRDGWSKSALDEPGAIASFKQWTEFYTKYALPVEFDFYSRFRSGEMAMAIVPYTVYNQLTIAAPEIRGLWAMAPVPGTERTDGTVDRAVAGNGNGIVMFTKTKNQEGAFAFMDWFTSTEVQARYGTEIEMLLGPAGRFETANIEAMKLLPWASREREMLLGQWKTIDFVELTPVSYYMGRNLMNAFRRVVYKRSNVRETLNYYNREIDREIARKRSQLGLD
jgi:ABC-type glycerol-3-phosphate transport system substrate-binding protein